jgi:hypothetical protein
MTWLWTALIVVGVVMIAVALWPNIRRRGAPAPGEGDGADQTDDR